MQHVLPVEIEVRAAIGAKRKANPVSTLLSRVCAADTQLDTNALPLVEAKPEMDPQYCSSYTVRATMWPYSTQILHTGSEPQSFLLGCGRA